MIYFRKNIENNAIVQFKDGTGPDFRRLVSITDLSNFYTDTNSIF